MGRVAVGTLDHSSGWCWKARTMAGIDAGRLQDGWGCGGKVCYS